MLEKIITYSFYLLFFLTPLFWTSLNFELFEYNKMILTYGFTVIILGAWALKMVEQKTFIIKRTPLDIPLLLLLGANILSTIFSIDPYTSIFGYYSRSNGGLLSIVSYLLLYFAFVSNFDRDRVLTLLKYGLASAFIISLWAISEHFGASPSCLLLGRGFNDACWVQDVQARVFASLGQPNWLAAYLSMLIFPGFYLLITSQTQKQKFIYSILLITMYLAFTFTYSRGPTLGLIGGLLIMLFVILRSQIAEFRKKHIYFVLISFIAINILFGSALTSFRLESQFAAPARPTITLPTTGTQLENGGTESGAIRLIVWRGALDIFKHYPIFGSGVETFAYSYYQFRPASHNQTSEWDFLYNKAHNEYLNYLATTGIVGFGTYILLIGAFLWWSFRLILKKSNIFVAAILASYVSYLIYNFFLFSVVIIAIFFYLFPALSFVWEGATKDLKLKNSIFNWIYRRPLYTKAVKTVIVLSIFYLLSSIFQLWYADTLFSKGQKASDSGNAGRAYNLLASASEINSGQPFYKSELGYAAAAASAALEPTDASLSAALKEEAVAQTTQALEKSPENVSFWRTAIRTYFELSTIDEKYNSELLKALDTAISLAPTDPKLYYNKAIILSSLGKKDEAIKILNEALKLKPDYLEAKVELDEATKSNEINR